MMDWITLNFEQQSILLSLIDNIISEANYSNQDYWDKKQLECVTNEFIKLRNEIEKGKLIFKYGRRQKNT